MLVHLDKDYLFFILKGKDMDSPLLVQDGNQPEKSQPGTIVSLVANFDLSQIDSNVLFDEVRRRGFYVSPSEMSHEDKEFHKFLYVRAFNMLSKYNNRQIEAAAKDLEYLLRDVVFQLKPHNPV